MPSTMLLSASDVRRLLPIRDCVDAVAAAFAAADEGRAIPSGVLGAHVDGGGFHVKTAGLLGDASEFVAKINANFPRNPSRHGLPTIQGILVLFDANRGTPLALMDSGEITRLRTAAASAVAARFLARPAASSLAICGCGVQGRVHLDVMRSVRPIDRVVAYDADADRARAFAEEASRACGIDVRPAEHLEDAASRSDIVVTCTTATRPVLDVGVVRPGTFIAAVGADAEHKQELTPALMASAVVVVDVLAQCLTIGDLHHAVAAGAMSAGDVRADLAGLASGRTAIAWNEDAVTIFDSTGTALEDVAAASLVYRRALAHDPPPVAFAFQS